MTTLQKRIYFWLKEKRLAHIYRSLDGDSGTLLDIGAIDTSTRDRLGDRFAVTLADIEPRQDGIERQDLHSLSYGDRSFDIVLCSQVLEHVADPVRAIAELKRVAKKKLIISVPNEPYFTLARFLQWEREYLWAITPMALKEHLGQPSREGTFIKRYYVGEWLL